MPSDLRRNRRASQYLRREAQLKLWIESLLGYKLEGDLSCLRDGIALCHLMLHLQPNSIDQIYHECENNRDQRLANVESFLLAAEAYGLPSEFCFQSPELVDGTNMPLVLSTLGMLSDLASSHGVPVPELPSSPHQILTNRQVRVVKVLNRSRKETSEWRKGLESWNPLQTLPEKGSKAERGIVRFQALVRGFLSRKQNGNIKQQVRRYRVAKEILETEQTYVRALGVCIKLFLDPLMGKRGITENGADLPVPKLSRNDVRIIFSDLRLLYKFHSESVLNVIEPRIADWNEKQCLGDVFLHLTAMMKIYTQYISNYSHSTDRLVQLKAEPGWESWRQSQELQAKGMTLSSFLIMPVQRVPRYILLLSELAKHTNDSHPDASKLRQAAEEMEKITHFLNTKKEEAEKRERLAALSEELFKTLGFNLAEAHRKLVREDTISSGERVILCSDLLVLHNESGSSRGPSISISSSSGSVRRSSLELRAVRAYPLDELVVIDMPFNGNAFQIRDANTQEVVLAAESLPSARRGPWREAFQAAHTSLTGISSDDEEDLASPRTNTLAVPGMSAPRLRRQDSLSALKEQKKLRLSHLNALEIQWKQTKSKKDKAYLEGLRRSINEETDDLEKALSCKLAKRKAARSRQTESCALNPSSARSSSHMVRLRRISQC